MRFYLPSYSALRRESRAMAMGLTISGAGLGMYMNFFFGNIGWNNILMSLALLLLPNWKSLLNFRLPCTNRTFRFIIFFQFICILYMVLGGDIDTKGLIYILFTVFMIIGIMSQDFGNMSMTKVVWYAWMFGWICLAFCGISLASGIYFIEYQKIHTIRGYSSVLVDLTMAGNLYTFIVCCLYYIKSSKVISKYSVIGIILSIVCMLVLGKRTPLIVGGFAIFMFIFKFYPISGRIKKSSLSYVLCFIALILLMIQIPELSEQIQHVWMRTTGGILDMIYGTSTSGAAAVERYNLRNWAYDYIENNFSLLNYFFGAGYMTKWTDSPLLQSYLDMGLIGFGVYLYFVIIKPLRITFSKLSANRLIFWGCALNFYNILSSMNSGTPYGHVRWIPLTVLILTIIQSKKSKQNLYA